MRERFTWLLPLLVLGCSKSEPTPPAPEPIFKAVAALAAPEPIVTEPKAEEVFQPFFAWVAASRSAPKKAVMAEQTSCYTDDPTDIGFNTCAGPMYPTKDSMRTATWYPKKPKAVMFESETHVFKRKPSCVDLGAMQLRVWRTQYEQAYRCAFHAGPLDGLEVYIRNATQALETYVRVTSPEFIELNRSWRDTLENQGL